MQHSAANRTLSQASLCNTMLATDPLFPPTFHAPPYLHRHNMSSCTLSGIGLGRTSNAPHKVTGPEQQADPLEPVVN
eukprot:102734-Prorocentrum_lima.AAC.1